MKDQQSNVCGGGAECEAVCPLVRPGQPCVSLSDLIEHFRTSTLQAA